MLDAHGLRRLTVLEILRVARGWDRSDAAAAIGCDRTSVGLWERGRFEPRAEMRRALERTFDAPWDVLRSLAPAETAIVADGSRAATQLEIERRRRFVDVRSAAAAIGVSPDVFRSAELGGRPLPRNRERIERAFGRPIAVLLQPARIDALTQMLVDSHPSADRAGTCTARSKPRSVHA